MAEESGIIPESTGLREDRMIREARWADIHHARAVEHIPAYSPQARGRSERLNRTFQDRLDIYACGSILIDRALGITDVWSRGGGDWRALRETLLRAEAA